MFQNKVRIFVVKQGKLESYFKDEIQDWKIRVGRLRLHFKQKGWKSYTFKETKKILKKTGNKVGLFDKVVGIEILPFGLKFTVVGKYLLKIKRY